MDGGGYLTRTQAEAARLRKQELVSKPRRTWWKWDSATVSHRLWNTIVLVAFIGLLFALYSTGAKAESYGKTCYEVGVFMEVAEMTKDPERKSKQWIAWLRLAESVGQERIVRMARNAHQSGMTADQMYRSCPYL